MAEKNERVQKIQPALLVIFAVLAIAGGFGNCSQTAVNAMLNEISVGYGVPVATSQWLTTGYILALGVFVPLSSYMLKRFSECILVMTALVLMAAGSLTMILSTNFELSLLARILQAAASGLIMPTMQTMIMVDLPKERMGLFMGINGVAMGFMVNVGPTIGGVMASAFGWRSFFWLLLTVSVLLAIPTMMFARKSGPMIDAGKFDFLSFFLCGIGFVGLLLGFSNASHTGFADVMVIVPIIVGALLLVVFIKRQLKMEHPLITMKIFENAQFTWGFVASCLLSCSFVGVSLIIPLFIQDVLGGSTLDAGLVMLPGSVFALATNLIAGALMDRIGARKVLLFTGAMLILGAAMVIFVDENTSYAFLIASHCVRSVGISGCIGPLMGWGLADLPRPHVSDGSSFLSVVRQAAASFGTSLMVFFVTIISLSGSVVLSYQVAFAFSTLAAVLMFVVVVARVR